MLKVSLLGLETVLRFASDAWSMITRLSQVTNDYVPPSPTSQQTYHPLNIPASPYHAGSDGRLPLLEGRQGSHAITCTVNGVSLRSLHVRAGSFALVSPPLLLPTAIGAPVKGFQGDLKSDGQEDSKVPPVDRPIVSPESGGVRRGGMVRKRPRLIFDRAAAQVLESI